MLYLEIEKNYDIQKFREGAEMSATDELFGKISSAPYYARNAKYIEENVRMPTDYIVLDPGRVDSELLKMSVRPEEFWNISRLTPAVIRNEDSSWTYKDDFDTLDAERLAGQADYIFSTTVDLALSIHNSRRRIRFGTGSREW